MKDGFKNSAGTFKIGDFSQYAHLLPHQSFLEFLYRKCSPWITVNHRMAVGAHNGQLGGVGDAWCVRGGQLPSMMDMESA